MPLKLRRRALPRWAGLALRNALEHEACPASQQKDIGNYTPLMTPRGRDVELGVGMPSRKFAKESQHGASPRDMEEAENEGEEDGLKAAEEEEEGSEEQERLKGDTFREIMVNAVSDRKGGYFQSIPGNLYRYWGLGIADVFAFKSTSGTISHLGLLSIFAVQLLGPPACIIYFSYGIDWTHWEMGFEDWRYIHGSHTHGISNLLKRLVALLFLFLFTLNGATLIYEEMVVSMKIRAMIDKSEATFKDKVKQFWIEIGPIMNCLLVLECCLIVYLSFIMADGPFEVVTDALAVTFVYNLDDIGGDLGFLSEDNWDHETVGRLYYEVLRESGCEDPDTIEDNPVYSVPYTAMIYRLSLPVIYLMIIALPVLYLLISGLQPKPDGKDIQIDLLKQQMAQLMTAVQSIKDST